MVGTRMRLPRVSIFMALICLSVWGPASCTETDKSPSCPPGSLLGVCRGRCQSDGDCLAPARCDRGTKTCREPIITCDPLDSIHQVPPAQDGSASSGAPDAGSPRLCAEQEECDLVTSICTPRSGAPCAIDMNCRAGEVCAGGTCVLGGSASICQRDSDCSPPAVCRLILGQTGSQLVSVCGAPVGPSESGARCRDNAECQSGLCLRSGTCFGGCLPGDASGTSDCHGHEGVICGQTALALRPNPASMPVIFTITSCVLLPPACQSDRDCDARGGSCQLIVDPLNPKQLRSGCLPVRGVLRASASCQRDSDCASGLCQGSACFAACRTNADCRPSALVCRPASYQVDGVTGSISSCVPGP